MYAERMSTSSDRTEILWVVETLEHCDLVETIKYVLSLNSFRNRFSIRSGDDSAMKVKAGDGKHDVTVTAIQRGVDAVRGEQLLKAVNFLIEDERGANAVTTAEEALHGERAFADEKLIAFEFAAAGNVGEIPIVLQSIVIWGCDGLWGDVTHLGIGMA